ncbi:MAG: hypothetical protein Q4B29_00230 [Candidatus Saccharibacteria bacterium]|nr:hypothetical protein [Candidatus Saccharibacteria bacterium]
MDIMKILLGALPVIGIAIAVIVVLVLLIKTANGNEALVVSGIGATKNGKPVIKRAGGRIVLPFIQKSKMFDLCVRTAKVECDVTKTQTGVPISIDWAVAYQPDADDPEALARAVTKFLDKSDQELEVIILDIVSGGVRAVISSMTPEEVMNKKEVLDDQIEAAIKEKMKEYGFSAALSIHEVEDADGWTYYQDLAAQDREDRKREAANITAVNQQQVRETAAEAERAAKEKELAASVATAERTRDADIKKAEFKAETDVAQAKANQAGEIEKAKLAKILAEEQGAAEVEKQKQANLAAQEKQKVSVTEAETNKQTAIIKAESEAAEQVAKAEGEAEANAKTTTRKAEAEAEARTIEAEANAAAILKVGEAEAKATELKGKAEAEATKAKGIAEAEAARQLSEAQAANDRVNFELEKIRIESEMRVEIATKTATIMAEVGKNATFYDFGGSTGPKDGDLLTRTLGNLPTLMAKANLEGQALNGENVDVTLGKLAEAVLGPLKGVLPGSDKEAAADIDDASVATKVEAVSDPVDAGPVVSPDIIGPEDYE